MTDDLFDPVVEDPEDEFIDIDLIDTHTTVRYPWFKWAQKLNDNPGKAYNITADIPVGASRKNIHGQAKKRGFRAIIRGQKVYLARR